jgi:nucleoside-diphosphate-sugar epimerase
MQIFIAGATGVIGRRVVPRLLVAGHGVTALARSPAKQRALKELGAATSGASLFDPTALRDALRGHEAVINLATHIPPASRAFLRAAWKENDRIRREGSATLAAAAAAAGAERFIQESFAPIYAPRSDEWIDENAPVRPARYARTTLDAEASAEKFSRSGEAGIVLRFAYFYGPDSDFTRDIFRYARKGWAATLGRPDDFISSVSHDDAAEAVVAVLTARSGIYNVVDDEPLRRRAFFDALAEVLGVPPPKLAPAWIARLAGTLGETLARSQRISNRKFREECGWSPKYPSVREGFRAVVAQLNG